MAGQKFQTGVQIKVDFFFGWKCHCISLFSYFFFLFLLSAWSLPKQVSCRCVVTHLCQEKGLFTGANDVPVVKVFALHSSTSLVRYTKKLFRTNSWLTLCFMLSEKGIAKFSSIPIPARFSPKSTCTVDTTIYQTQVRMFFKAHSLKAFEQPLIFRNRSESKHLGPSDLCMINTVSDGCSVKSYFLMSIRLDWCEI